MKEQDIQRKIIKYLEQKGAYVVKIISGNRKGIPDIIVCYEGKFIAIEVKQPGKENSITELQKYNLKKIEEAGGISFVASSIEDVKLFLG